MSDSINILVADAIAAVLNGGRYSVAFIATRGYLPFFELEDLETLTVTVVPAGDDAAQITREKDQDDVVTEISVQRRFPRKPLPADLDPLMQLIQEVRDSLRFRRLEGPNGPAVCIGHSAAYSDDHLERLNQFTALLRVTHRAFR